MSELTPHTASAYVLAMANIHKPWARRWMSQNGYRWVVAIYRERQERNESKPDPNCEICAGRGRYRRHEYDCDDWQGDEPPIDKCDCEAPSDEQKLTGEER